MSDDPDEAEAPGRTRPAGVEERLAGRDEPPREEERG